ncbi:hypothetical protein D1007_13949 [Hordeum vulgare]|nr:hypothetical protein D1007_13949 [Hordeum vulgare]
MARAPWVAGYRTEPVTEKRKREEKLEEEGEQEGDGEGRGSGLGGRARSGLVFDRRWLAFLLEPGADVVGIGSRFGWKLHVLLLLQTTESTQRELRERKRDTQEREKKMARGSSTGRSPLAASDPLDRDMGGRRRDKAWGSKGDLTRLWLA